MRWTVLPRLVLVVAGLAPLVAVAAPPADSKTSPGTPQKVVVPFDFESKFDEGRYGQMIGDMIWTKLHKQGGFIIPEAQQETRDWCERNRTCLL